MHLHHHYHLLLRFHLLVIVCWLFITTTTRMKISATLLSSSSIDICTRTSANSSYYEPANCNKKIVMTLAVDGGAGATESVLVWKTGKDSSTGKTLSTPDSAPIRITVKKSIPYFRYPLYYVRNFNAQPTEETIYTALFQCQADSFSSSPTCGRAYDYTGAAIAYSEGFCCTCSACALFGFCSNSDRGYTRCSLFGDAASAACLTFKEIWYSGYAMGPAETWYSIEIDVEIANNSTSAATTSSTYKLTLGPDALGGADNSPNRDIFTARLVGDFSPFRQPLNLESSMLFVPAAPENSARVLNGNKEWMIIPSYLVTVDGGECNKIGTSYQAFNGQGSRCDVQVGSCLKNQIEDYRNADLARLANGLSPIYLASAKGNFVGYSSSSSSSSSSSRKKRKASSLDQKNNNNENFDPSNLTDFWYQNSYVIRNDDDNVTTNNNNTSSSSSTSSNKRFSKPQSSSSLFLAYQVEGIQASVITLVINADKVALSVNVAPARILFVNSTYTTLTANSREGQFKVFWMNTGDIEAQFYIGVDHCTEPTMQILAETISAQPRVIEYTTFRVTASAAGVFACNITLQNAVYAIVDSYRFTFVVNETKIDNGAQGGTGNGANGGGSANTSPDQNSGCGSCQFWNPICFVANSCFWQFSLQGIGALLMAAAFAGLLYYYFCVLKKKCCLCSSSAVSSDDDDDEKEKRKKQKKQEKRRNKKRQEERKRKQKDDKNRKQKQDEESDDPHSDIASTSTSSSENENGSQICYLPSKFRHQRQHLSHHIDRHQQHEPHRNHTNDFNSNNGSEEQEDDHIDDDDDEDDYV